MRENIESNYCIQYQKLLNTCSKIAVHKESDFLGNKIVGAVTKSNSDKIVKQEPVEETIFPSDKRAEILNQLRQKISQLFNCIKLFDKKWIEVNDLSSVLQYSVKKNMRFKASMVRSDFCDYSVAYIVVKGIYLLNEIMMLKKEIKS